MSLHEITLDFWLRTIQLKSLNLDSTPECYAFHIFIKIHGEITNSQLMVDLSTDLDKLSCRGSILNNSYNVRNLILAVDYGVILLSLISFFSCARSIYRGKQLYSKVRDFFTRTLKVSLGSDKWEFLSGWFILIIINDILVLMGTFIKVIFASKFGDYYTICSYFLGLGSMMVWIGVLRYVGFSYKNNILILTLCRAMPNVARFMLCAIVIFLAFTLCGWVVLGPYHVKFRSFSTTLECLYSLINGDELFATFSFIDQDKDFFIFLFSRIYIYLFCSLYIYVVLNLFITLIIEAYEDIKELRANGGKPNTFMWNFIRECPDDCDSALYRSDAFQTAFYRRQQRREKYSKYAENVLHPFVCAGRSICSGVSLVYDRCSSRTSAATGARHSPGDEDLFHPSQRPSNERSPLLVNS